MRENGLPNILHLTHMIIYNVFLTSWTLAYESNVFLSWTQSNASLKKINPKKTKNEREIEDKMVGVKTLSDSGK